MKCPVCNSGSDIFYLGLYDDRYGYPGCFDVLKCPNCKHKFLDAQFTPEQLSSLYTDYYPRSSFTIDQFRPKKEIAGFYAWWRGDRRFAYTRVPPSVRVLDIGCGFGETLAYHKSRGCDVYGVEADKNIRRVADHYGFNVHVGLFASSQYDANYFDYVTLDQVIEHDANPLEMLHGIAKVLKPGGTVFLSTPNANGWGARLFRRRWIHWHVPYHQQHFSKRSMQLAAEQAGLKVRKVMTITSSDWLDYQWRHLVSFPIAASPSAFWSPKALPGLPVRFVLISIGLFHQFQFNHLLSRIIDILGVGDNFLFVLEKS